MSRKNQCNISVGVSVSFMPRRNAKSMLPPQFKDPKERIVGRSAAGASLLLMDGGHGPRRFSIGAGEGTGSAERITIDGHVGAVESPKNRRVTRLLNARWPYQVPDCACPKFPQRPNGWKHKETTEQGWWWWCCCGWDYGISPPGRCGMVGIFTSDARSSSGGGPNKSQQSH